MTDVRVTDALVRDWTRDPEKVGILRDDTWFLETAEQLVDTTPDAAAVAARTATLLVKPDGVATGSARAVVDWLIGAGFVIHDAVRVSMDHNSIRALWYHQWNIASPERRMLADLLCGLSPGLLLAVGPASGATSGVPCSVRLTELKGPTDPDRRRPEHLRGILPGGSYLLNQVHTADEPADVLRELGIYLDRGRRGTCLRRVAGRHDATADASAIADRLDAEFGGHSTDTAAAWAALQPYRNPDETDVAFCLRLLDTEEPVASELRWPLLVAGSNCLPMRTRGGDVVLSTPPAGAWESGRIPQPGRATVDRRRVHRLSVAETLVTGCSPAMTDDEGHRYVEASVQLGRAHPVYTDHLGAQRGRVDLLALMEAVRQVCIVSARNAFAAKDDDVFVVREFNAEFHTLPPAFDGTPAELQPCVTFVREHRRTPESRATGADVDYVVLDADGGEVAHCWGSYSWVRPSAFGELRTALRGAVGLSGDPVATAMPDPVAAAELLRCDPANSVVARDHEEGYRVVVDTDHPVHFDHPLDHVPGMLQVEAARQAVLLTLDPAEREQAVVRGVHSRFHTFAELDLPVRCRVVPRTGIDDDDGEPDLHRVEFVQGDAVVAEISVRLDRTEVAAP